MVSHMCVCLRTFSTGGFSYKVTAVVSLYGMCPVRLLLCGNSFYCGPAVAVFVVEWRFVCWMYWRYLAVYWNTWNVPQIFCMKCFFFAHTYVFVVGAMTPSKAVVGRIPCIVGGVAESTTFFTGFNARSYPPPRVASDGFQTIGIYVFDARSA